MKTRKTFKVVIFNNIRENDLIQYQANDSINKSKVYIISIIKYGESKKIWKNFYADETWDIWYNNMIVVKDKEKWHGMTTRNFSHECEYEINQKHNVWKHKNNQNISFIIGSSRNKCLSFRSEWFFDENNKVWVVLLKQ